MAADLSLKDAFSLFTHHLRAGGYEEHRVSLYEQTVQGPVKRLIATYLPDESTGRDIDELPLSHIPHEIIQTCMSPTHNFTLRTARKFFKFLIHAGMLDPGLLPTRKTVLIKAIEQPPDELSAAMSLYQACRAFVKHLWEHKSLLYEAVKTRYMHLQSFAKWQGGHKSIGDIGRDDIRSYLQYLQQERGYRPISQASTLTGLRTFFAFFATSGVLKTNPTATLRVKKPKKRPYPALSEQQLTRIITTTYLNYRQYEEVLPNNHNQVVLRWLAARDWAIVSLLITTGIRCKEIAQLHTDSIDLKQRFIKINGKGDPRHTVRERIIPVTEPITLSAIETYLGLRPQCIFPHLFISCRLEPLHPSGFREVIQKIARSSRISTKLRMTDIRASFGSLCAAKGIDPLVLKQIMGHSSLATTMKYYLTIKEHQLKEAWENSNPLLYFNRKEWEQWIL
jgi:site-specific recombinase XerD